MPRRSPSALTAVVILAAIVGVTSGCAASPTATEPVAAFAAVASNTPKPVIATATPTPTPTPTIVVTKEVVTETTPIGHTSGAVDDGNMDQGTTAVVVAGQDGVLTRTIEVTKQDGVEVSRTTIAEVVTTPAVDEVVHVGTRAPEPVAAPPAGGCDANYTGACVPIASDVDCAGGSGNGPAYVTGPVTIVGSDVYDLDRDGDGIACD
jgi:hypothetical protein